MKTIYKTALAVILIFLTVATDIEAQQVSAGKDHIVCSTTTVLTAQNPYPQKGRWTLLSGYGVFEQAHSYTTRVDSLFPGNNIFRWTVEQNGKRYYDDVVISNNSFEITMYDQEVCDSILDLSDVAGDIWHIYSKDTVPIVRKDSVRLRQAENIFMWSMKQNGCEARDVSIITNNSFRTEAGESQQVTTSVGLLKAKTTKNTRGEWIVQNGNATINEPLQAESKVVNLTKGSNVFRWTEWKNGCFAYDETQIFYNTENLDLSKNEKQIKTSTTEISVYPNPNNGIFDISLELNSNSGEVLVEIFSINQTPVFQERYTLTGGFFDRHLDLSHLTKGVYTIKASDGNTVKSKKLVVK